MNNGKTIFSQIMSNIPEREFKACVDRNKGDYRSRNFTCKNQFLVMSYAQLTNRGSLRDIENCLTALSCRLYHCGISYAVSRNTLAKANEKRDWRIYANFAQVLVKKVRPLYAKDDFRLDLDNMVYVFDITIGILHTTKPQMARIESINLKKNVYTYKASFIIPNLMHF